MDKILKFLYKVKLYEKVFNIKISNFKNFVFNLQKIEILK